MRQLLLNLEFDDLTGLARLMLRPKGVFIACDQPPPLDEAVILTVTDASGASVPFIVESRVVARRTSSSTWFKAGAWLRATPDAIHLAKRASGRQLELAA